MSRTRTVRRVVFVSVKNWLRLACVTAAALLPLSSFLPNIARVQAQSSSVTITVDAASNVHPISPLVYGVAYGGSAALTDLNCPINRYGGNNASRYNWQLNADNRDSDWYFESIPDDSPVPGERGDTFISTSKSSGAEPMITIPMVGWVGKLGPNRGKLSSFSIAKY
ncbi:MAG: glycoside hydrolase family 44 protein, partial [Blastocatellia bacterium]